MNHLLPNSPRWLRTARTAARWAGGLLLAALLLLAAAWAVFQGWIVPRIGDFRPALEARASRAIGAPITVGAISAHGPGWLPTIELQNVALLDEAGREALRLPRVLATLSPRSLWRGGVEQLVIDQATLDMRRDSRGRIFVAGIDLSRPGDDATGAADWLFAQTEVVLRNGTLRWTDELRGRPALSLSDVVAVSRNGVLRHRLRIDATPPSDWGQRFTLMGDFRQPLLARAGRWQDWSGQLHGDFAHVDVAQLRRHIDVGIDVVQGRGALRWWADVDHARLTGGVADLALDAVEARFAGSLEPLALHAVAGRLGARRLAHGFEFTTAGLQFRTDDGIVWPGGNVQLSHTTGADGQGPEQGQLRADRLDLAALARMAYRLPLGPVVHEALAAYGPHGLVESLAGGWSGPIEAPIQFQAKGRVTGLALAAAGRRPGVRGATVDFEMTQLGGKARFLVERGAIDAPTVLEDRLVPVDRLAGSVQWQRKDDRLAVQLAPTRFSNAHAEGEVKLSWQSGRPTQDGSAESGALDLTGRLTRGDGTQVHRYLPLAVPAETRRYVRDAVQAGRIQSAQFRVRGDLRHLPFNDSHPGEFRIAAKVDGVRYAYVPAALQARGQLPWPVLANVQGELVFDRSTMAVRRASADVEGRPGLHFTKIDASIADLAHSVVQVTAQARGPATEALAVVNTSPLAEMTGRVLDNVTATGLADYRLQLRLPLADIRQSGVAGSVLLAGNDLRAAPDTPLWSGVRGAVAFTESGFTLQSLEARLLGGNVRVDGGMRTAAAEGGAQPLQVRLQGTVAAEGLRQARELGAWSRLADRASGATSYQVTIGVRQGRPEFVATSTLQGLALNLPAPLGKPGDAALPVRVEVGATPGTARDQVLLEVGRVLAARYQRDRSAAAPRVLRGMVAVGAAAAAAEPLVLPEQGVRARVDLGVLDVAAWQALLEAADPVTRTGPGSATPDTSARDGYLPTSLALRAGTLLWQGRTLHDVVTGISRDGDTWRADLQAREAEGTVEYRAGAAPRVRARLARLAVPHALGQDVATLVEQQPGALPALDIVVDDFDLGGRRLGRLEVEAVNRGVATQREWRLAKLNLTTPEARFVASGNWTLLRAANVGPGTVRLAGERRTLMDFQLEVLNAGELLARFGMPDVLRRGQGRLEGQVAWVGSPLSPDYPSMAGQMQVEIGRGQFLKSDPGMAKLLGVLSLQSLPRRLALDFRDVFSEGFAFDFIRGNVRVEQGVALSNNLQMKGLGAAVLMDGRADLARETQTLRAVVVPELNAGTASLVATAINPAIGLGSFLAQLFLRGPLMRAATQEFLITGSWADPRVTRLLGRQRTGGEGPIPAGPEEPAPAEGARP